MSKMLLSIEKIQLVKDIRIEMSGIIERAFKSKNIKELKELQTKLKDL